MAWTTPGTAVAGEVLTAAFWNEQVRDNLNALDAAGANAVGSVLIASADFSAASTVDITSVFSADYVNYELHVIADSSNNDVSFRVRMMSGASAETAANYNQQVLRANIPSGVFTTGSSNDTAWTVAGLIDDNGTAQNPNRFYIFSPFTTARETSFLNVSWSAARAIGVHGGTYAATTSYDGIQIYGSAGTVSGRYWVYGLRSA